MDNNFNYQDSNNDIYKQNGFEPPKKGAIKGFDLDKVLNDSNLIKFEAIKGIIVSITLLVPCFTALSSSFFERAAMTQDPVVVTITSWFKVLLIILTAVGILSLIQHGFTLYVHLSGNENTSWGRKYILLTTVLTANAGRVMQFMMGAIFFAIAMFAFIDGPNNLAEGSTVEGLYVVSGIFAAVGLGLAIAAIIGIVRSIKYYLDQVRDNDY